MARDLSSRFFREPSNCAGVGGQLNCSFEDDFCQWTTEPGYNGFERTDRSLLTETGQPSGHNTGNGKYIHLDRATEGRGRLVSPWLTQVAPHCLSVWYYMYGPKDGQTDASLRIFKLTKSAETLIWKSGRKEGSLWKQASVSLSFQTTYKVMLEFSRSGDADDIAVSDIIFTEGECSQVTCDFEHGYCGWNIPRDNEFEWFLRQGKEGSWAKPKIDHTLGTPEGFYAFVSIHNAQWYSDWAFLESPSLAPTTRPLCFQFWYSMLGTSVGNLTVHLYRGGNHSVLWHLGGHQDHIWNPARITLQPQTQAFKIVITGTQEDGDLGVVAVDDTSMTDTDCSGSYNPLHNKWIWILFLLFVEDHYSPGLGDTFLAHDIEDVGGKCDLLSNPADFDSDRVVPNKGTSLADMMSKSSLSREELIVQQEKDPEISLLCNRALSEEEAEKVPVCYFRRSGVLMRKWRPLIYFGPYVVEKKVDDVNYIVQTPGRRKKTQLCHVNMLKKYVDREESKTSQPIATLASVPSQRDVGVDCDFTADFCGWTNLSRSDSYWHRSHGRNSTQGLGPAADHTTASGYYVFIDASFFGETGKPVLLYSPVIQIANDSYKCFSFWYNMYGDSGDTLYLYEQRSPQIGNNIWTRTGAWGDAWNYAQVNILGPGPINLVFEGIPGPGMRGDIAIDDLNIISGQCSGHLACNFGRTDLCGYHNVPASADLKWIRKKGSTATSGTGPRYDHSLGTRAGNYAYVDATGRPPGDKARLFSRTVRQSGPTCLKFWYSMYGNQMGTLNIYVKQNSSGIGSPDWSRSGDQGQGWNLGQMTIFDSLPYQVVFEAVVGSGPRGDIALDDLSISGGHCKPAGECNFDHYTYCSWANMAGDALYWRKRKRTTPMSGTGPASDHTLGTSKGIYIYLEAKRNTTLTSGQKARLLSESFPPTGMTDWCFRFWYHMYGTDIGTLNVYITHADTQNATLLWQLHGDQGNLWKIAQMSVHSTQSYKILVEGITSTGSKDDIALDDFTFISGGCGVSPLMASPTSGETTSAAPTVSTTTLFPVTSLPDTFSCNFEDGICGWIQSKTDAFNWTRRQGRTRTSATGPDADHTTGHGYYMYIEASGKHFNDKAQLESSLVPRSRDSWCLNFWYNMYGRSIYQLNVYTRTPQGLTKEWMKSGNKGKKWIQTSITINIQTSFTVVIEGVIGRSYTSDIAIDDVSIVNLPCIQGTYLADCDFEATNLCGYTQDVGSFRWTSRHGSTPTSGTGPSADHTYGTKAGQYMLLGSCSMHHAGDKVSLKSRQLQASRSDLCVTFYYHMYGRDVGTLNFRSSMNGSLSNIYWSESGDHGNQWNIAQVTLPGNVVQVPVSLVFEGVCGSGRYGDIALDDVEVSRGACTSFGSCNFDVNLCTWQNVQSDDFDWLQSTGTSVANASTPRVDHSRLSTSSQYIYVSPSTGNGNGTGSRAWLVSGMMDPSTNCLSFWYYIVGQNIGTLRVSIKYISGQNQTLWELSGSQGNKWQNGQTPVTSNSRYQLVVEAVLGTGTRGSIAVDDISIAQYNCGVHPANASMQVGTATPLQQTTSPQPTQSTGNFSCNFDDGPCGWNNVTTDDFDWLRGIGATETRGTGPSEDHTTGYHYYYYAPATGHTYKKAQFLSPVVTPPNPGGPMCMRVWYSMYGENMGTLNIYLKTRPRLGEPIFKRTGEQGVFWNKAEIDLSPSAQFQIVVEAAIGNGERGDMAVDDVSISSGPCSAATTGIACDFEGRTLCAGYSQTGTKNWTITSTSPFATDHTYGTTAGHILYVTSSRLSLGNNRVARLVSGPLANHLYSQCLEFWYNTMGEMSLAVYQLIPNRNQTLVFQRSGTTRKYSTLTGWVRGEVNVPANSGGIQLAWQGFTGRPTLLKSTNAIGLDDITMVPGTCSGTSGNCNFESDFCSWSNVATDDFDWVPVTGQTMSEGTGPVNDHTTRNATGTYIYIEASSPQLANDKAVLLSPPFAANQTQCMHLFYNMYGSDVGGLQIWLQTDNNNTVLLWEQWGNQAHSWLRAQLPVVSLNRYRIWIVGVIGAGYQGDIAIDDISFTISSSCDTFPSSAVQTTTVTLANNCCLDNHSHPNNCPSHSYNTGSVNHNIDCTFEKGICGWEQDKTNSYDWILMKSSYSGRQYRNHPHSDQTYHYKRNQGSFLFYAGINGRQLTSGRTVSKLMPPTSLSQVCFGFWYVAQYRNFAHLRVLIKQGNKTTVVWSVPSRSGYHSNYWTEGQLAFYSAVAYNIIFEARKDSSITMGYVALDDITVSQGKCQTKPRTAGTGSTLPPPSTTPATTLPATTAVPSAFDCTFETGYCRWTQSTDDDFDWTRFQGPSPSDDTGPSVDHTLGTAQGYYLYIDASPPRRVNDTARLVSSAVLSANPQCLHFWYHMYGPHVNTLSVILRVNSTYGLPVWTRVGTYDSAWHIANVNIQNNDTYNMVFEAVRGTDYKGDIALDDIHVTDGPCAADTSLCTFEDSNICGYTQPTQLKWIRRYQWTPTHNTGPGADHTYGTRSGHYMYIEPSNGHRGQRAQLVSPAHARTNGACLRFWYHMYGRTMGTLRIYAVFNNQSQIGQPLWSRSGNQGNQWHYREITVNSHLLDWKAIFEGEIGGSRSDMAIDDITITQGACPLPGSCDFEADMCTWHNTRLLDDFDWMIGSGSSRSTFTGPAYDHTLGTDQGRYMYIDTGTSQNKGDKARLVGQQLSSSLGFQCLQFWYNMQGEGVGTLNVYTSLTTSNTRTENVLWSLTGNQGSSWQQGRLPIPANLTNYYVILEAVELQSQSRMIAIDDIVFLPQNCGYEPDMANPAMTSTTLTPGVVTTSTVIPFVAQSKFDCDFQQDTCTWQTGGNPGAWAQTQGPAGKNVSGPVTDHTKQSDEGWSMTLEAHASSKSISHLVSAAIPENQHHCLEFYYTIQGPAVGMLRLYIKRASDRGDGAVYWRRSGSQGDSWHLARVEIPPQSVTFKALFIAGSGPHGYGYYGIDDIKILNGTCPFRDGVCSFETVDMCGSTIDNTQNTTWVLRTSDQIPGFFPQIDHSYRTNIGKFITINSTIYGQKARLISPEMSGGTTQCFSLYYQTSKVHHPVPIRVYIQRNNTVSSTPILSVHARNIISSNIWEREQVTIQELSSYKIVLEGMAGSAIGAVVVDDFSITDGACNARGNCNFEEDFCAWTAGSTSNGTTKFTWMLSRGSIPSQYLAPPVDHTSDHGDGQYIFVTTSLPTGAEDSAVIYSPSFPAGIQQCLEFWFIQHGKGNGSLQIFISKTMSVDNATLIWKWDSDSGNTWKNGRVPFWSDSTFVVSTLHVDSDASINELRSSVFTLCLEPKRLDQIHDIGNCENTCVFKLSGVREVGLEVDDVVSGLDVVKGHVGNKSVSVLRDTGSSTVFVNSKLVGKDNETGRVKEILLADGTRRKCQEVLVDIGTPFISGKVVALVLDTPFADIIVGNYVNKFIPREIGDVAMVGDTRQVNTQTDPVAVAVNCSETGVDLDIEKSDVDTEVVNLDDTCISETCEVVQTRSQAKVESLAERDHLIDTVITNDKSQGICDKQDLKLAQKLDSSLDRVRRLATEGPFEGKSYFIEKDDVLYRFYGSQLGNQIQQIVVPKPYRSTVLSLAHDTPLAGHLGNKKTRERILQCFFWPGIFIDVANYCKSCPECQKGKSKGIQKAPLVPIPHMEEPSDGKTSVVSFILETRDRMRAMRQLVCMNEKVSKKKQKTYYDRKARHRVLERGQKVLLLLPTSKSKLLAQWKGPYEVVERVSPVDYRIRLSNKEHVYHINMLKRWFDREDPDEKSVDIAKDDVISCLHVISALASGESAVDEEPNEIPSLSMSGKETVDDVTICSDLTREQVGELESLLSEFSDVLSDVPKQTSLITHSVKTTTDIPIHRKPYPIPYALQDKVKKELQQMKELGIIEDSDSPYSAPMVLVKRPEASLRICIDFRELNRVTVFDPRPMPRMDDVLNRLGKAKYLSKIDLTKGYWQVPLDEDAKQKSSFVTPFGQYRFTVMPFGMVCAPATFVRLMAKVLQGYESFTEAFIDDIGVYSDTWNDHIEHLRLVFLALRESNLSAKPSKCSFGFPELVFLAHVVGNMMVKPTLDKLAIVQNFPQPLTKKQVKSFLGFVGFYRKFVQNFATLAIPLTDLTKKSMPNKVIWNETLQQAFESLKLVMLKGPVLRSPDFEKQFILRTDACDTGVGAVLEQSFDDGRHPVLYMSKKLSTAERNYAVIEKECYAIVWSVKSLRVYLEAGRTIATICIAWVTGRHFGRFDIVIPIQASPVGTPSEGFIALDDISITNSRCAGRVTNSIINWYAVTTAIPLPGCDFSSNFCGWTQVVDDDFDWTRSTGLVNTDRIGPFMDRLGRPGSFLYIDMANPRRPNDIAELSYGRNYSGESYCLVFWYHMYGPSVNTLNVLVGNKTMWTRSGTHQDQWHEAYIALLFDYATRVVINNRSLTSEAAGRSLQMDRSILKLMATRALDLQSCNSA
ncbi:hypothetical protein ScPMuIL_015180 [Solemya velum]